MATLSLFDPILGTLALSPDNGIVVEKFDPGFPSVRENRYDEPNSDGNYDQTVFFGERVVSIEMTLLSRPGSGITKEQTLRTLMKYCHVRQRSTLKVFWTPDGDQYQIDLRTSDVSMAIDSVSKRKIALVFKTGPFFLSSVYSGSATDSSESVTSSLTFPFTFPAAFGGVGVSSFLHVDNSGDAPLWLKFQVNGPIKNPMIKNRTTGEAIAFTNTTLSVGQQLLIDMKKATATVSGEDFSGNIDYDVSSWFSCDIGEFNLTIEGSETDTTTALYAFWQIPYL